MDRQRVQFFTTARLASELQSSSKRGAILFEAFTDSEAAMAMIHISEETAAK